MAFDVKSVHEDLINWIKKWFDKNGKDSLAVIGISGGKDSTVCAALLVEALGKDRVIGVSMPNGVQTDISDVDKVFEILKIKRIDVNINETYTHLYAAINASIGPDIRVNVPAFTTNTPARIRMTVLYGISSVVNGRVCNTCNLSEDICGYSTKFGDAAGDFSLLSKLTVTEVRALGDYMKLPKELVHKIPSDGMSGMSDEDKLGFTYEDLDKWIRNSDAIPVSIQNKILEKVNNPNNNKKIVISDEDTF